MSFLRGKAVYPHVVSYHLCTTSDIPVRKEQLQVLLSLTFAGIYPLAVCENLIPHTCTYGYLNQTLSRGKRPQTGAKNKLHIFCEMSQHFLESDENIQGLFPLGTESSL